MNLGDGFQNDSGVLKPLYSDIPCSLTLATPENLHDYSLSFMISYSDDPDNTTQTIWLRRNYSDYKISLPGKYGDYDFSHEYGYTIHTTDGFEHITVKRVERNYIVDDPIGVNDNQVLVEDAVTSFTYAPNTKLQLHFSIYGDILDIYADWELVCSIEDDTTSAVHFGGTRIVTEGEKIFNIHDISINTDYYFWSRKGNAFTYRGQEAVPMGFNTMTNKNRLDRDLIDCINGGLSPESDALSDLRERMEIANECGARLLRMLLRVGYVHIGDTGEYSEVDAAFALNNEDVVFYAYDNEGIDETTSTLSASDYTSYLQKVFDMAREHDLFVMPTLRDGAPSFWKVMETSPSLCTEWNEECSLRDYDYMNDPNYFLDKVGDIVTPFTDEPAVMAWEFFNEPPAHLWLRKVYSDLPDFQRVKDFFLPIFKILTDEDIHDNVIPDKNLFITDKHIQGMGLWPFDYKGWLLPPKKEKVKGDGDDLLLDPVIKKYNDFIDWHAYGQDGYNNAFIENPESPDRIQHGKNSINYNINEYHSDDLYGGKYNETCPPILAGEIGSVSEIKYKSNDYDRWNYDSCVFASYRRHYTGNDNDTRVWTWKDSDGNNITSTESDVQIGEILGFDASPEFLRQNQHYKLWQDWYEGPSIGEQDLEVGDPVHTGVSGVFHYRHTGQTDRKMGICFWVLVNHPNSRAFQDIVDDDEVDKPVYDPANREGDNNTISGYTNPPSDDWNNLNLNEKLIYPFYKELFMKDWSQR